MWQTKYASAVPKNFGLGLNFRPCSEGNFVSGRPWSVLSPKGVEYVFLFFAFLALDRSAMELRKYSPIVLRSRPRSALLNLKPGMQLNHEFVTYGS